jgi:hypothetical protein
MSNSHIKAGKLKKQLGSNATFLGVGGCYLTQLDLYLVFGLGHHFLRKAVPQN